MDLKFLYPRSSGSSWRRIVSTSEEKERIATLSRGGLVGMYPATAKLPTWKVAEFALLALSAVAGAADPWPAWLREAADVMELTDAFAAVHQPSTLAEAGRGADGETTITIRVRLADGPTPWSPQMSQAVVALVGRLEPEVPVDGLLVIDSSGLVLVPASDAAAAPAAPAEHDPPPRQSDFGLVPLIAGAVIGLLVIAAATWYLVVPGRRPAPAVAAGPDPILFI